MDQTLRRLGLIVLMSLTVDAIAQVKIDLPKTLFKPRELIDVRIVNKGAKPVSFCVQYGHWSSREDGKTIESTPTPVYVQARSGWKWHLLIIGPDVGSIRGPVVLAPGASQRFPFRLLDRRKLRIILDYWIGESDKVCDSAPGQHTARSRVFRVD